MSTEIILIRHGQSLGNAKQLILGSSDMDLSELGYRQAEKTAEFLKNRQIDAVYSSYLMRAKNTAEPHARIRGLKVVVSKELREIYCGEWENLTVEQAVNGYGDMYGVDWLLHFGTFRMPGGESTTEAGERFYKEMERIAKENANKCIVVVAHGAVIRYFWAMISGVMPEDIVKKVDFATNASFSTIKYENNRFIPCEYSCDAHLSEVGITSLKDMSVKK